MNKESKIAPSDTAPGSGQTSWYPFEDSKTIGTRGSENGIILLDEEHDIGARITLEKDGYHLFALTCGIYGFMMLTGFASTEEEARVKYMAMRSDIALCLEHCSQPEIGKEEALAYASTWAEAFDNKYS